MTAPTQLDLERDICRDYARQENGKFVLTRDIIANKYGVSTHTVSAMARRNGIRRYVDNQKARKPKVEAKPTRFSCQFCGFICESKAGHEVCR